MTESGDSTLANMAVVRITRVNGLRRNRQRSTLVRVDTGFAFTLTTQDPVHFPLPHPHLLYLHAAIMRVVRAAGASAMDQNEEQDWGDESESPVESCAGNNPDSAYILGRFLGAIEGK